MKYCWTTIYVKDLIKSIDFYQGVLGLEIHERFHINESTEIVMLGEEDSAQIELIYNNERSVSSKGLSLGFEVKSLEESLMKIKEKGINDIKGPFSPMPSSKFFFIEDPDGVEIQIVQNDIQTKLY